MKRHVALPLLTAAALAAVAAPALAGRPITVKGSDTMVILGQRWAEKFMNANPGQVIMVTGGGSGTGIAALINGTTEICQSSRAMKQDEKLKLRDRYQTMGVEIPVAKDGLAVYVHHGNPVKELSIAQLAGIYRGTITNWKAVGGPDATIILYGRENSSGTYGFFKEHVLGGRDFSERVQTLPGTAAVVNAVAKDPNGIGYGGAAYAKGVRDIAMKKDAGSPAVLPTAANVHDGSYPLSRHLYFYLRKKPAGDAAKFVAWVLSPEGQELAGEVGYFPLK
jgi:phosphate transport system substrate-binding protein